MKRLCSYFIALALSGTTCRAATPEDFIGRVSASSYSNHMANLYCVMGNTRGFTFTGSPRVPAGQHDQARDYIQARFEDAGFDTFLDPFDFRYRGKTYEGAANVVAIKPGVGGTNVFLIAAHYDSVDAEHANVTLCPGADDNASGVAGMLSVAESIQDLVFRDTLIFAAFDAEEKDYKGATQFLDQRLTTNPAETNATVFLRSQVAGMLSVDMIGYDRKDTPPYVVIGVVSDKNTPFVAAVSNAFASRAALTPYPDTNWTGSDHSVFHAAGINAAIIVEYDLYSEEAYSNGDPNPTPINPRYHSDTDALDTPNYLDVEYAANVTRGLTAYLLDQAGAMPSSTLKLARVDDAFRVGWTAFPGVAYRLLATPDPSDTNGWSSVQFFPPTNTTTELFHEAPLDEVSRYFKVLSE